MVVLTKGLDMIYERRARRFAVRNPLLLALTLLCLSALGAQPVRADDGMFPAAPAAKPYIDFDGRGFLIEGKRTFIASGSLHYPRVPRALWRDRLLRFKRAGFNTVQTYAFWNFHEPKEGQWDFRGDKDLDAFLKLVKSLGMYATVRVGPYVCAEWDSGGYPVWLRFKPGVRVREDNPQFEGYVDKWLDHVMPIVAANQINHGGAVIMVQLENEHPQGWGREMPNGYFRHLRDKALALGLQVPYFFSGLHHGSDPAGNRPWDSVDRANPWYTTEFWPGWYSDYGPLNTGDFRKFDRGFWKILAYGGNGLNFYMLHGGTNFDSWNNDEDASSYDYGAAVGQAGDLRPIYYKFKRAAWFARSFPEILENSTNATDEYQGVATNAAVRVTARRSPAGTILFLDNPGNSPVETQVRGTDGKVYPEAGSITLAPGEIMPVILDAPLAPGIRLTMGASRILGVTHQGNTTTLVVYGPAGGNGELVFRAGQTNQVVPLSFKAGDWTLNSRITAGGPQTVRVLAVNDITAGRTWFVEASGQNYVVCGPDYVGEANVQGRRLRVTTEQAGVTPTTARVMAYGPGDTAQPLQSRSTMTGVAAAPMLGTWQSRPAVNEAQPGYNASSWLTSTQPAPMGADGDYGAYAWYRTMVHSPQTGMMTLNVSQAGDWLTAFVNGLPAGSTKPRQGTGARTLSLPLQAGDNTLAVFTAHYGRPKLFGYLGPIEDKDPKGLAGAVTLAPASEANGVPVTQWQWKPATGDETSGPATITFGEVNADPWQETQIGADVFHRARGFAWYRTTLPTSTGAHHALHFEDVDDNATVYLNGRRLLRHEGWGQPFDVPLDAAWKSGGPNEVEVLVENTDNTGGINGPVTLQSTSAAVVSVTGWRMRGGIGEPDGRGARWQPVATPAVSGVPTFFRSEFTTRPPGAVGPHPILRVTLDGLSRGFVWLNGHNLGRYPEKVPVNGIYLPECWLKSGTNTLIVFDEEGHAPAQVKIVIEQAASRMAQDREATL